MGKVGWPGDDGQLVSGIINAIILLFLQLHFWCDLKPGASDGRAYGIA
jgi:hypothetical protein